MKIPRVRDWAHSAGRVLTRVLLDRRWRHNVVMRKTYRRLYLLGKHLTESGELAALRKLLSPGMVVADVGANVGFYTFEMATAVGPAGRILAFEPDPFNVALLDERRSCRQAQNVDIFPFALGDRTEKRLLYCSAYNRADNRLHASHNERGVEVFEVETRTLDEVLAERVIPKLDAMKIDVQGAEAFVLRGAAATIARGLRWIWIEFSPPHLEGAGTSPRALLQQLDQSGLQVREVGSGGDLRPLIDIDEYLRRLGDGYGDLVLLSPESARALTPSFRH